MTTGSGGGVCEVPLSPAPTTPPRTDGLGDQTDYQYDRGRPTVICAGSVCATPREGEEGMLDAGESLRIEYPDTSTGPVEVICAGAVCDGDPLNDNRLPKRMILPGSVVPGEHLPRLGDMVDLRHNLIGEVTARRDGAGVTAIIERDDGGRERRVRYAYDQTPDATGLPPIEGGIASIETILDDMGLVSAREYVAADGRVSSRVAWEYDAWGQVAGTQAMPSMAGSGGPAQAMVPESLESTLGMRFHRSWVDGMAMGEGAAWRGSRLDGITMPGSPRGLADLAFGRDGRHESGLSRGLGAYTGAVGMIAFPDDGRSVAAGGVPRALAEYVNQGIAWPEEVGLPQAGYEREQFRGMGMAVIPAPEPGHSTGLNQFGEPTVDRWHEVCAAANCGPVMEDRANAPFDQRVADPPPTGVCACSIYTEDHYEPEESKQEEIVCAGLLETTRGWDAGRARSGQAQPLHLRRITQYSIQGTNIASRRELRSEDRGRTFVEVEATRSTFTTANQVASSVTVRDDGSRVARSPRYDGRGHLRDEGCVTKADGTPGRIFQYDHDGRLVGVYTRAADGRADVPLARFAHDAAGRLASATYNRGFIGGTDALDSTLDDDVTDLYVQDLSWRIVAVVRREAGPAEDPSVRAWVRERWVYHHAGDGEGGVGAIAAGDDSPATRFIDDDGDGNFETVQHFLCNRRGDVVAIVEPGVDAEPDDGSDRATVPGRVVARVWYDDYGMPRMHGPLDVNQDGVSDVTDLATFAERLARFGALAADPQTWRDAQRLRNQLDWDRDGAVLEQDGTAFAADLAPHVGERFDARETLGNLPLYAGAWWDAWLEVYHVRHRVLDPKEGRWLQRDPIGYAGGSNLYAYVGNQPGRYVDPLGLRWAMAGGGGAGQPAGDGGDREECPDEEAEEEGWFTRVLRDLFMGSGSSTLSSEVRRTRDALLDETPLNAADMSLAVGVPYIVGFQAATAKASELAIQAVLELALGGTLGGVKGAAKTADHVVELVENLKRPGTVVVKPVKVAELAGQVRGKGDESLLVGTYSAMTRVLKGTGEQANHVNPRAVFGDVLGRDDSLATPLKGSITEAGSEHRKFHDVLERFWDAYRGTRSRPTIHEYSRTLESALMATGRYDQREARLLTDLAVGELAAVRTADFPEGLGLSSKVPRIPGRIPPPRAASPCGTKGPTQ